MKRKVDAPVVVIGAGVAGSTAAYVLRREGLQVVVLESEDSAGGRARTVKRKGFRIDSGAVYLLNLYDRTIALLGECGTVPLRAWSPPAGLRDDSSTYPVRYDFLPSFLALKSLRPADKFRLAFKGLKVILGAAPEPYETDSLAAFDRGETMEAWSRRELGDRVHEFLVRPWIEPAFGVGVERLSVPFLTGILKRAYRARFRVPVDGMGAIADGFLRDADLRLNTPASRVARNDDGTLVVETPSGPLSAAGVVVATPGFVAADLLDGELDAETVKLMRSAPYAAMAHVVLAYADDPWPSYPTDMVLPVGPGDHPVVGIILHGRKSPEAVPAGGQLVDLYFNDSATRRMTDEELIDHANTTVAEFLGSAPDPTVAEVFRYDQALAFAPPGHYERMQQVRRAMPPDITVAGDYLAHLGIETAVVTGERAALDLLAALRRRGRSE